MSRIALIVLLVAMLSGCPGGTRRDGPPVAPPATDASEPVPWDEPYSRGGNPPFYEVFGKRYHVLSTHEGYREEGVASWYGKKFHGRNTSNGEIFDMYSVSAAHKTLPIPTYARVTNLRNGQQIIVRINDRGPFVNNRLIDLSYAAALKLDMIRDGTTLVSVEALSASTALPAMATTAAQRPPVYDTAADTPAAVAAKPVMAPLYVQVGAFSDAGNARRMADTLALQGFDNVFVRDSLVNNLPVFRVRFGPIDSVDEYDRSIEQLNALGITNTHLATDEDTLF